ncbi:MAG: SMI1/KNR4 family protein [Oscillospiraceae bacterium]|nr:SMI1/KNR4 family protein [Oscillospiraceae bacterium]
MEKRIEIIKGIVDDWMNSEFSAPATDAMIDEFERKMDIVIPASYRDFLILSNGARLFGGDCFLYSVNMDDTYRVNFDFSEGQVPKELLIVGFYHSSHICYDKRYDRFYFYEYEDYDAVKEECSEFSDLCEVLDYIIDIATG